MDDNTLVRFNVQNVKYSVPTSDGKWSELTPYGTATKIAIQSDTSVKKIYGDGRVIKSLVNEKNKTATLTVNNVNNEYEITMTRKIRTSQGLADTKQRKNISHIIYFETCGVTEDDEYPVAKTMLYGVTSTRPAETFDQKNDDINESTFEIPLEIAGTLLKENDGVTVYKDDKGREVTVYQMTLTPDDPDYETFGEGVPVFPKMSS